jgi:hypothetical protein
VYVGRCRTERCHAPSGTSPQLVLVLQEQQLLVLQEQQLEHEQLELDAASSIAGSTSSSISNVMLSSAASSFLPTDMLPPFGSIDLPPAGRQAEAGGSPQPGSSGR